MLTTLSMHNADVDQDEDLYDDVAPVIQIKKPFYLYNQWWLMKQLRKRVSFQYLLYHFQQSNRQRHIRMWSLTSVYRGGMITTRHLWIFPLHNYLQFPGLQMMAGEDFFNTENEKQNKTQKHTKNKSKTKFSVATIFIVEFFLI